MADIPTFLNFKKLLEIKRYSANSINTYLGLLKSFHKYIGVEVNMADLENKDLLAFIIEAVKEKQLAYTTHKQLCAALKLFYKEMYGREIDFLPVYPTIRPKPLPKIISTKDVKAILDCHTNLKHKTMLTVIYALGLRSGELISMRINDIDGDRNQIHIRSGKGNKDRVIPLPESLKVILRVYYLEYKPKTYLFCGQKGKQYSQESLRKVFKTALIKSKVNKSITLHGLRHAYATHLMDRGTDVRIIKELLGHSSIKTTLIYTHVTNKTLENVPSPLDFL
ncbi:tyrosine-type recombinase/integrase [uncultured Lacinutrix sp.]|uniref:tyrosine-type recombinase/integrase n=1 Tax=uncultured Lacinutrix sp. TaxID=574032 RepID=UPI002622053D|nr:tyrosine-type recombinase/integrase [uncultured Lacinutrix sp.]